MPVVPVPPTIGPGIPSTSALSQFRDAIRFLQAPPIAELRQTAAQSIPNTTWTSITFDTQDADNDVDGVGGWTGPSSQFVARYPGWYQVAGAIAWSTGGFRAARWAVNSVALRGTSIASSNIITVPARTRLLYLAQGDYVELQGYQNTGGALNTAADATDNESSMMVKWVSN